MSHPVDGTAQGLSALGQHSETINDTGNVGKSPCDSSVLTAALTYGVQGIPVFPCRGDKGPWTAHGFQDATTDARQIRHWWTLHPDALIGCPTGTASGIVALDIDTKNDAGGDRSLAALVATHGPLPPTRTVQTRSGGWHYYFAPVPGMRNSQGKIGAGIDMRADGGYIIVPPSAGYAFITGTDNAPLASMPTWLVALATAGPDSTPVPEVITTTHNASVGDVYARARAYLAKMPAAVSGSGGHNATYAAATALVHGFDLTTGDALAVLCSDYNPRCVPPWSDNELRHKVEDAASKPHHRPKGWLLNASPSQPEIGGDPVPQTDAVIDPRHPFTVARLFAQGFARDGQRLVHHHAQWLSYAGTHYREMDTAELRARLYRWLSVRRLMDGTLVAASQTLVNNVLDALRSAVHEGGDHLPRWMGSDIRPDAANLIAFRNGLLDVERWLADSAVALLPHDSEWLSTNVLPFGYTPTATCPQWETFVAEVAAGDDTWVAGLAMMFGYLLTHDTAQQKIFLFQGAPRAGKGTICRVLREMLGHANVAGPSLPSLCGEFGLWPLVGKSVAIIPDAHAGRGSDAMRVLEVLKSISGEDAMDVNRKHRDQQTMRLPVRFLIACNSMLDLPDPSGALAGRLVLFPFTRSFQGKEDHGLEARLLAELPGILRWSLAGLRELRTRGRLLQPMSGEQVRADFARLSSPIRGFIDDRLVIDPAGTVPVADAYQEWKSWCEQEGHQSGATSSFGAKLLAALPGITKARLGGREQRQWAYRGIRPNRSGETLGHAWTRGTP